MIVIEKELCGISRKKAKLFGIGEDFIIYRLLFWKVIVFKEGGKVLDFMRQCFYEGKEFSLEYLPQMKEDRKEIRKDVEESEFGWKINMLERELESTKKRANNLNERCSKLTEDNKLLRDSFKTLKGEEVTYSTSWYFPD